MTVPNFSKFNLHPHLNTALQIANFEMPTPVQAQAIPAVIEGRDLIASAQTGTGKTGAFVIPALQRLLTTPVPPMKSGQGHGPRMLVLTPTRELAQQVMDAAKLFGKTSNMKTGVIVGGVGYAMQYQLLARPLDILVATPGRLIDHLEQRRVDFSRVELVVLDEADRMLDMGFLKPVERILDAIEASMKKRTQTLLFTATMTPSVAKVAARVLHNPVKIELAPAKPNHSLITQKAYRADNQEHKFAQLISLMEVEKIDQAIIFAATKHGSDKLAEKLVKAGFASAAMHGGMKQNARKRTLDSLHRGSLKLLVATDVAARGLDVKELGHVINFDLPQVAEDYVHRIGRTGRSGASGVAISLIAPSDVPMLRDIEKVLGKSVALAQLPGHESELTLEEFARQGALAPRSRKMARKPNFAGSGASAGRNFGPRPARAGAPSSNRFGGQRSEGRSEGRFEGRGSRAEGGRPEGRAPRREDGRTEGRRSRW
jgi:superfamily II DNA/RNA helicase